jgi:hypothetical protein
MPQWYKVGSCGECRKPIWSDSPPASDGPPTGKIYNSCNCEKLKKDPLNKPLPPPPKAPEVLACEMAGGHIVTPREYPMRLGPDPAKWSMQHEICPCIRCGVNVVIEGGRHKGITFDGQVIGQDPTGITILVEEAA